LLDQIINTKLQQIISTDMKMKRVSLGFSILAASSAFILSCTKEPNVAPVPDTETQSAVYASYANFIACDIDQVSSFLGGDQGLNHFYIDYPGTATGVTGSITVTRDTTNVKRVSFSWNKTKCTDGVEREGTMSMFYNKANLANADYIQKYGFSAEITPIAYKVNGWLVELSDPANPIRLTCTVPAGSLTAGTNLTWKIVGKLKMTHPTDPNKNMVWETQGLSKTLVNSSNPKVYDPKKLAAAINWSLAIVNYTGKITGNCPRIDSAGVVTTPLAPFTMTINPSFPLTRDFTCFPIQVSGVVLTPSITVRTLEFHPFNLGATSFTVGTSYPRQIYYGNEGNNLPYQCDNTGEVLLKGNSYRVNFLQ
jgi:hypothetical protein